MDTTSTGSSTIAGLPIPAKEKVVRWMAHGGLAALVVTGVLTFMPYVNKALDLLLNGFWSLAQLGMLTAAVCFGGFALFSLWPAYKKLIESVANKATWAIFEYDPITPMELWLREVNSDKEELESQYREVGSVISQNEQIVNDNITKAKKADARFAQAVQQYGADSTESRLMSLEPGTLRESADRIKQLTQTLYTIRDALKEVVDATAFTQKKAELDVDAFKQEYTVAEATGHATDAANRVLRSRSDRKQSAMVAMKIIHDKYAGNFGRLQSLRELSKELLTSVDVDKGTYHQEALDRLRNESRLITGGRPTLAIPQMTVDVLPNVVANGAAGSFYNVPRLTNANTNSQRISH